LFLPRNPGAVRASFFFFPDQGDSLENLLLFTFFSPLRTSQRFPLLVPFWNLSRSYDDGGGSTIVRGRFQRTSPDRAPELDSSYSPFGHLWVLLKFSRLFYFVFVLVVVLALSVTVHWERSTELAFCRSVRRRRWTELTYPTSDICPSVRFTAFSFFLSDRP